MTRNLAHTLRVTAIPVSAFCLMCIASVATADVPGNNISRHSQRVDQKLEEYVTVFTNIYFALGACDGFIASEEEAQFDPFGPMLEQWPDSFKRQMSQTRMDGKSESLRLARRNRFSRSERAELCQSQWDSAKVDLNQLLAKNAK